MSEKSQYPMETSPSMDDRRILEQHHDYVQKLSQTIRTLYASQTPFRLYHGPSFALRKAKRSTTKRVDISHLDRVIHVNTSTRTVLAEPGATMADLIAATLYHGLMPAVVLEFPGITCGSAFASSSTSSSSFRMGLFEDTVAGIEVVLGNGEVVSRAGPVGDQSDLFWGCAGGLGSLGVVTMMEIKLVPAMPYVELSYFACRDADEVARTIEREVAAAIIPLPSSSQTRRNRRSHSSFSRYSDDEFDPRPDFVDSVAFSAEKAVVMVGRLIGVPDEGTIIHRFSHRSDPYFYSHISSIAESPPRASLDIPDSPSSIGYHPVKPTKVEAVALPDYFFRFDRGVFFAGGNKMAKHAHADSPIFRALTSPYLHSSPAIRACRRSGLDDVMTSFVASVPPENTATAVLVLGQEFGVWPIWICPSKIQTPSTDQENRRFSTGSNMKKRDTTPRGSFRVEDHRGTITMTIASFGLGKAKNASQQRESTRAAKGRIEQLSGGVALASCAFSDEHEFQDIYGDNEGWYQGLRRKYGAERLPSVFERVGTGGGGGKEKPMWMLKSATIISAICHLG